MIFRLRTHVIMPGTPGKTGLITALGEDMDHGDFFIVSHIDDHGRPAITQFWRAELEAANVGQVRRARGRNGRR